MNTKKVSTEFCWMIVGLAVLGLVFSGAQAQTKAAKQISIETLEDIENINPDLKLDVRVDREDATYQVGEPIIFCFTANKDCRVTLFNISTSGAIQILFPNEHAKDNLVKAGTEYRVPAEGAKFRFAARAPVGEDVVKAFATLEQVALVDQSDIKPAGPVQEVSGEAKDIAIEVQEALKPLDAKRWAEAEKTVKIVEKR